MYDEGSCNGKSCNAVDFIVYNRMCTLPDSITRSTEFLTCRSLYCWCCFHVLSIVHVTCGSISVKDDLITHLLKRNFDPTRYKNLVLDCDAKVLTVYLPNLVGQFTGFQQYRPLVAEKRVNNATDGRYFTYSQRAVNACWGLETLDTSKKDLYIVEGIFKASALHMIGENALAVLTANPKPMQSWLHTLPFNLIGIGDNDKAGRYMMKIAGQGFQSELDLDEYSLEELHNLIRSKK